jgi:uncharacterized protein (DUF1499 family)
MNWLIGITLALVAIAVLALLAGQIGWLKGSAPTDLGVREGRLKAPATTPNSVSSQAALWPGNPRAAAAQIDPLPLKNGDGAATMAALQEVLRQTPGATVVQTQPDYIYAQFTTPLMKYTDDVEFWLDPTAGVVQVRSASRLGESDMNLNRKRVERIRAQLAQR